MYSSVELMDPGTASTVESKCPAETIARMCNSPYSSDKVDEKYGYGGNCPEENTRSPALEVSLVPYLGATN